MKSISLSSPDITSLEIDAVVRVLKAGRLSLGSELSVFEKEFSQYLGVKHALAVSSGTAGLHCVMKTLGIQERDEVITTPFSFIASANSILFEGARPVFVDIDPVSLCLDPEKIEEKITAQTRAILVVHVFGVPCDMDRIETIARRHGLCLIEDACEALGALWRGKKIGSFGKAAVFAFYPNKQITTGEGGMIVSGDSSFIDHCRSLSNQGRNLLNSNVFERLGYNYRMTDIQAALGRVQLARIEDILARRREVAGWYAEALREHSGWVELPPQTESEPMSWFVYVVRLAEHFSVSDRSRLRAALQTEGIQTGCYFPPIHLTQFYREKFSFRQGEFPVTESVARRTLALPFHNGLKREEVRYVAKKLMASLERIATSAAPRVV